MATRRRAPKASHCRLTLDEVDDLNDHAHHAALAGLLVAAALESHYEPEKDEFMEALAALVDEMITDAKAVEALIREGCRATADGRR